jgi:hypothetical protein
MRKISVILGNVKNLEKAPLQGLLSGGRMKRLGVSGRLRLEGGTEKWPTSPLILKGILV